MKNVDILLTYRSKSEALKSSALLRAERAGTGFGLLRCENYQRIPLGAVSYTHLTLPTKA